MIPDHVKHEVERLNNRLADFFGRSPAELGSLPMRAWMWSADLTYIGLNEATGKYVPWRQLDLGELGGDDRWVTATWTHQGGQKAWEEKYGNAIAWPDRGLYISDNGFWLRPGSTPTDKETNLIIEIYKHSLGKTVEQKRDAHTDQITKAFDSTKSWVSDVLDDIPDHVPGRRGQHISFGGYDVPLLNQPEEIN